MTRGPSGGTASLRVPSPPEIRGLRKSLRAWYAGNRRALPWRGTNDPYAVLVSEFMLQQTQVATVLPYYGAFIERFPSLEALAEAPEAAVQAAWSGLGYYRRARNLQAAASALVRDHGGKLPGSLEALRDLPGVGEYTAAALGSIVHGIPKGVVDGNVIRVLTRLAAYPGAVNRTTVRRSLQELADRLVDPARPGDWNQAVMELGATVCTPKSPRCEECPWQARCRARAQGEPEAFPRKGAAPATVFVERVVGILRKGNAVLLVRRRDPRLLDGTWEFPGVEVPPGREPKSELAMHLESTLGKPVRVGAQAAEVRHSITNRRLVIRGYEVQAAPMPRARREVRRWMDAASVSDYPVSSMTTKMMRALGKLRPRG